MPRCDKCDHVCRGVRCLKCTKAHGCVRDEAEISEEEVERIVREQAAVLPEWWSEEVPFSQYDR